MPPFGPDIRTLIQGLLGSGGGGAMGGADQAGGLGGTDFIQQLMAMLQARNPGTSGMPGTPGLGGGRPSWAGGGMGGMY